MKRVRRWLILIHRYLGIGLSLIFTMWFVSGIAMIYAGGMPELSSQDRLAHMAPLNLSRVQLSPSDAVSRTDTVMGVERLVLLTIRDRPAYRITSGRPVTVFADNGELLQDAGPGDAVTIAARFMNLPEARLHPQRVVTTADQWTIGLRRQMPLHKIVVTDEAATELYVSARLGEVVLRTTRRTRALAWVSAIPHWMYFAPLRRNDALWRRVVLWSSGLGTIAVIIGLGLALLQRAVRYRGWMRWHYWSGAVFGVFALTWVFSGMLSMEPWNWTSSGIPIEDIQESLTGGPPDPSAFLRIDVRAWNQVLAGRPLKEVEFLRIEDEPYYLLRGVDSARDPLLLQAKGQLVLRHPSSVASLVRRVQDGYLVDRIADARLLTDYDSYYYARNRAAPLPVLRLKFDDPDQTWVYVDPALGRVVAGYPRLRRVERWLYHGLHSLDFSVWYNTRLWDIGVIALSLGGATLSVIGVVIGARRIGSKSKVQRAKYPL